MTEYKIIRSNRKTLAIQVDENADVIVRAPYLCTKNRIERFLAEKSDWIEKAIRKQQNRQDMKLDLSDDDIKQLKIMARTVIPEKVAYFAKIMGVEPTGIKITSAQKRFGSCSGKNSLCFSYVLMLYSPEAVDYVVVHELAHIIHHNHSKAFYNEIAKVMPDYKQRENLLKGKQEL